MALAGLGQGHGGAQCEIPFGAPLCWPSLNNRPRAVLI